MPEKDDWTKRCLVITGTGKSGTSLLMDLIDGHPNVVVYPDEPYFRDVFARKYKNKAHLLVDIKIGTANPMHKPKKAFVETITAYNPVARRNPVELNDILIQNTLSLNELDGELRSKDPAALKSKVSFDFELYFDKMNELVEKQFSSLSDLMTAMIVATVDASSLDSARLKWWAFKDAAFYKFDTFFSLYLEGKAIIIVRDPHAQYLSVMTEAGKQHGGFLELVRTVVWWQAGVVTQLKLQEEYGEERIMVLYYEDLVSEPNQQMRRVAGFLGIEYDEAMTTPTRFGVPNTVSTSTQDGGDRVYRESAAKWKTKLHFWEKYMIDVLTYRTAKKMGYSPAYKSVVASLANKALTPLLLLAELVFLYREVR
ncbi:MAG: sulfotransferase [Dehalococcoidia bacterium]|nr:sulfotransferase [Dehalococcoidia bacterium]